jgi:hypothetical protein
MTNWIEKTINPPGINKPNKGALFSTIGDTFERVRRDALKAFNAHFPYLADKEKLDEHGRALLIPRLSDDTEEEYRNRVTTASFFLMRAGERAYITGQLDAHFGGRYAVSDDFLNVYVKVRDLAEADRKWLLQFLDGLINPGVKLTVAEWFHFLDMVIAHERLAMRAGMTPRDTFNDRSVKLNGRVKLDGRTKNETVKLKPKLDGRYSLDGELKLSGALLSIPATGAARVPVRLGRGILDLSRLTVKPTRRDKYAARIKLNGALKLNGLETLSGYGRVNGRLAMRSQTAVFSLFPGVFDTARIKVKTDPADYYKTPFKLNGASRLEGGANLTGERGALERLAMSVKNMQTDLYTARLRLNGALKLGGGLKLSGFARINDRVNTGLRYCRKLDGKYQLDGNIKLNSGILFAA